MRSWLTLSAVTLAVTVIVVAGCRSMFAGNDDNTPSVTGGAAADDNSAIGFFVDGGHDVEGGGPPPLPEEIAEQEGEETQSHFRAIQIDPAREDTAGVKFLQHADMNGDGMLDLVSGHNQSLPVQLHLQVRNGGTVGFRTIQVGGSSPLAIMAGLELADMDGDGFLDIVVLSKATGFIETCGGVVDEDAGILDGLAMIFFHPGNDDIENGDAWQRTILTNSNTPGAEVPDVDAQEIIDRPEFQGYVALAVGDVSGDGLPDIMAALNADSCGFTNHGIAPEEGNSGVDLFINPGADTARSGGAWPMPAIIANNNALVYIKDVAVHDVDADGRLDMIITRPIALGANVRWFRNPGGDVSIAGNWIGRPIGHIQPSEEGADVVAVGDMDNDGFEDVLVRASRRNIVQWFRRPTNDTDVEPVFPPDNAPTPNNTDVPWQVFTLGEYAPFRPEAIAIGDLTGDGMNNAVVSVGGALFWYDPALVPTVFHEWSEDFILDDTKVRGATDDPTSVDFNDTGTQINSLLVVDVDDDGLNDVVAAFDRRVDSGLNEDAIIWFRNTLLDDEE